MFRKKTGGTINFKDAFMGEEEQETVAPKQKIKSPQKTRRGMQEPRPTSIYKKIAITFVILTLGLVGMVVYFSVVRVKIVIIPNREQTATSFIVTVYDRGVTVPANTAAVPGVVERTAINVVDTFKATGQDVQGAEVTGRVKLVNDSSRDQPLIRTTRLLAPDGRLYRLDTTVRVPAGGTLENVPVYGDEVSEDMTIEPTKFTIPGLSPSLQELIYAESTETIAFRSTGDPIVTEGDLQRAEEALKAQLLEKLTTIAEGGSYERYDNVLYDLSDADITYAAEVSAGDKVAEFDMVAAGEGVIIAFTTVDMSKLAEQKITETLADDKKLQNFDRDNFAFEVDRTDIDEGLADVKVEAVVQMVLREDTDIIKPERLVGLTREQLDDYLSSLREVAGYEVTFTPNWINQVPALTDHITVEVKDVK